MNEPRPNIQSEVVRRTALAGEPLPADGATVHRFVDERSWMLFVLGEQVGEPVQVAQDAESVVFPEAAEAGYVHAVLWCEGEPVVTFPPLMLGAGSELRLAPLPMRCTVTA